MLTGFIHLHIVDLVSFILLLDVYSASWPDPVGLRH